MDGIETSEELHFFYDAQSRPAFVEYGGVKYRYINNLQGDIMAIVDATGTPVVEYKYDAWGKHIGTVPEHGVGAINPFRYRGYVYDNETSLYYLENRYYNPTYLRFINADKQIKIDSEISQAKSNQYSYCRCNPITRIDSSGYDSIDITDKLNAAMEKHYQEFVDYIKENGVIKAVLYFIKNVRNNGIWDIKTQEEWNLNKENTYIYKGTPLRYDEPGNIHYGYVGSALFGCEMLKASAGLYQIKTGTSDISFAFSYFDDPIDSTAIEYGYLLKNGGYTDFGITIKLEEFEVSFIEKHQGHVS